MDYDDGGPDVALAKEGLAGSGEYDATKIATELIQSYENFKAILDMAPAGIIIARNDGIVSFVNRAFCSLLGENIGQISCLFEGKYYGLFNEDGLALAKENFPLYRSLTYGEKIKGSKILVRHYDTGLESLILVNSEPIFGWDGGIMAAVSSLEDITGSRSAGYRDVVDSLSDWVWATDDNIAFTYVNGRALELLGRSPGEVIGKTVLSFMEPDEAKRVARIFSPIFSMKSPFRQIRYDVLDARGTPVTFESSGDPIFDKSGKFIGYAGTNRDVTNEARKEKELAEMEARYAALLRGIPDVVIRINKEGIVTDYKMDRLSDLLLPVEDPVGQYIRNLLPRKLSKQFANAIKVAARTREVQLLEYSVSIKGEVLFQQARFVPGEAGETLAIVHDVSDFVYKDSELDSVKVALEKKKSEYYDSVINANSLTQNILDSLPVCVLVIEPPGNKIIFYTRGIKQLLGEHDLNGIIDGSASSVRFFDAGGLEIPHERLPLSLTLKSGEAVYGEQVIVERRDRSRIAVSMSSTPILDDEGNTKYVVFSIALLFTLGKYNC